MDELAKRFADLAEKYGPSVADAALAAARMEAYSMLAAAAMWAPIIAGLIYLGRRLRAKADSSDDWDSEMIFGSWAIWFLAGVGGLIIVWTFIDPWTWTQINHPELWIAKKAFHI